MQSASRNPVVHIASHFKFTPGTEIDSFLLLGDGSKLTLDMVRKGPFFSNTELLTLSVCETAMGNDSTGREIEGFGAIAMKLGAKSVIATLWSVVDDSTSHLMKEFYRLKEEKNLLTVEALRQAQLSLLNGTITSRRNGILQQMVMKSPTREQISHNAMPIPTSGYHSS